MGGDLAEKVCTPCRGGIPPLTRDEANALLKQTPAWTIVDDPMRIERRFAFGNFRDALMFVDRVGAVAEAENLPPGHPIRLGVLLRRDLHPQNQRASRKRLHPGVQNRCP